jgi:hypothetical protein
MHNTTLFRAFVDQRLADTEDLPFCGYIEPAWTLGTGHLKYYSDCYVAPYMKDQPIKRYKYDINLDLTCVMPNITQRAGDIDVTYSTVLGKAYVTSIPYL